MRTEEQERVMHFLIERYDGVSTELEALKSAQLLISAEIETLTKVVFGLLEQVSDFKTKLELQQKALGGILEEPRGHS